VPHFVWVQTDGEGFLFECPTLKEAEELMDREERDAEKEGYDLEMKLIVGDVLEHREIGDENR